MSRSQALQPSALPLLRGVSPRPSLSAESPEMSQHIGLLLEHEQGEVVAHHAPEGIPVEVVDLALRNSTCARFQGKRMKYPAFLALFILFAGCQSTGVVPMSQDSYYIGKKDGSPGLGVSLSNKAAVYREAHAFCNKKGLDVFVLRETVTPSAPAKLGSTELQFKCAAQAGTAQPLVKDPDTVVEIKQ